MNYEKTTEADLLAPANVAITDITFTTQNPPPGVEAKVTMDLSKIAQEEYKSLKLTVLHATESPREAQFIAPLSDPTVATIAGLTLNESYDFTAKLEYRINLDHSETKTRPATP